MRPVIKWAVGQNGVIEDYNPSSDAKEKLLENFGNEPFYHCSYCDRIIPKVNLEVEHIQPKEQNPLLEYKWVNFLIACKNCNLAKHMANVPPANILLPQLQNTWNCFLINNDGTMEADPANAAAYNRALRTVEIFGLDRGYNHPRLQSQDDRYNARRHVLIIAKRDLTHYENGVNGYLDDIVQHAITLGFWYVWMKVFQDYPEVQDELISWFTNTYADCRTTTVERI
jgi:uncharacterized protein (TIGR02646 family)